jgi:hypothetical protein
MWTVGIQVSADANHVSPGLTFLQDARQPEMSSRRY